MKIIAIKERIFEAIEGVIYVFEKGLEESGLSTNYYRKEKSKGNNRLEFIDHPKDRRYNLVAFETLSEDHQNKIINRFGSPYDYVSREPIKKMVHTDHKAEQFFLQYKFNGSKNLPLKRVKQYTRAAEWLNMLVHVEDSRNKPIKELGINVPLFFDHVKTIMQQEKENGASETFAGNHQLSGDFPTTYQNLRNKMLAYKETSYSIIIDKMYGNNLAAKINDDVAEAQLLTLLEHPMQYDDVMVCMMYNMWAKDNSYKLIEPATVGVWRRKCEALIMMGRNGSSAYNEKYIRQVKGLLPSAPLSLVEHDDNNLDFLFSDTNNYDFNKYVAICVVDSRTKLLLGKSYRMGQSPEQWQVYHAYLDAMYYIRSLTGAWHAPFEIKADKWASKSLSPFYEKIATFIPPSHGNKHRGYIEQFFASPIWKRSQQLVSQNNWSGNNITAKNRGVNEEVMRINAKNRPMVGNQAEQQLEDFFHLLRHMPDIKRNNMKAPSKEQIFLQEWALLHNDDKRAITDEQFLLTFGIKHEPQGRSIAITNRGVEPQINNNKLSYDLPEAWMYNQYIGAKVNVYYDPYDMSRVLITNEDDIRFIAKTAQLQPRALKDQYTGSRTYLNAILAEKKDQVRTVSDASAERKLIVNDEFYNAEAMLQGGVMLKELKNEAEQVYLQNGGRRTLEDMINDM